MRALGFGLLLLKIIDSPLVLLYSPFIEIICHLILSIFAIRIYFLLNLFANVGDHGLNIALLILGVP